MRFRFTFVSGARAGQQVVVDKRVVRLGRDPSCDVALDPEQDAAASSNHAQIMLMDNGEVLLSDLGSSNGTFIGDQQVTRATPISTGTTITLGKGGPQVTVSIEPSLADTAETPPAAPAKKTVSKGCLIGVIAVLVLIPCVIGVGILMSARLGGGSQEVEQEEVTSDGEAAEPEEEAAPPPEAEPDRRTAWAKLGDGSVLETTSKSKMQVAGQTMESETVQRYTIVSRDDTEVTVEIETAVAGTTQTSEQKFPLRVPEQGGEEAKEPLEERQETVEVPAGSFDATYRKMEQDQAGQKMTVESWTTEDLPLPVKSTAKSDTLESVTELTRLEKK